MTRSIMGTGVLTMNIGLPIGLGLVIGLAPVAVADNLTTMFSLAGKCLAVTAMDAVTDPSLCINKLVSIETTNGRLGFAFTLTRKGDSRVCSHLNTYLTSDLSQSREAAMATPAA